MSETTHDLAIVGYGPTGMTLAALLGRQGHSVVVLERYAGLYNLPRAACFDDEIMRTFQKLGVVEEVLPGAVVQHDYDWVNAAGETLVEISYDDPAPGGWAQLYMMYQPHIETVLDRLCSSLPSVEVHQATTVTAMEADEDGVTLRARRRRRRRDRVRARFVVGADGGTGFVRPALGIGELELRLRRELAGLRLRAQARAARRADLPPGLRPGPADRDRPHRPRPPALLLHARARRRPGPGDRPRARLGAGRRVPDAPRTPT